MAFRRCLSPFGGSATDPPARRAVLGGSCCPQVAPLLRARPRRRRPQAPPAAPRAPQRSEQRRHPMAERLPPPQRHPQSDPAGRSPPRRRPSSPGSRRAATQAVPNPDLRCLPDEPAEARAGPRRADPGRPRRVRRDRPPRWSWRLPLLGPELLAAGPGEGDPAAGSRSPAARGIERSVAVVRRPRRRDCR